ncbi:MAG: alanine dehydrogenase, partial [Desulfobulbaceae bacterium]|nr:alanine dehydrogenase [Candidatus Desulfobia pelagia]
MIIGVPKEIKDKEFRVGIVPAGVKSLSAAGHSVIIEKNAGTGSNISDTEYAEAGADILAAAADIYKDADMIIKVKEPLPEEYEYLKEGLILYTYLHLAPLADLTDVLLKKKVTAIGYETVQLDNGYLPLLAPMSEVAGRMAVQVGAHFLEKEEGGRGILLGGVPGVEHGHVTIIGGGTVGSNAGRVAVALGAQVTVLDTDLRRLAELDNLFGSRINTLMSNFHNIEKEL